MQAITINIKAINMFKLASIDKVKEFLEGVGAKVCVISSERTTDGKRNLHYHVMAETDEGINNYLWGCNIWNESLTNELGYYDYIIKDGNYKVYDYTPPMRDKKLSEYQSLLDDMFVHDLPLDEIRIKYPRLFIVHYNNLIKIYQNRSLK